MGSDCTTFAASHTFLSGIRLCLLSERGSEQPGFGSELAHVPLQHKHLQSPQAGLMHTVSTLNDSKNSCNSCIRIMWLQQGNWAPSDVADHRLPISFSNDEVSLPSILFPWHVLPWHVPPQIRLYILQDSGPCCEWSAWNSWSLAPYTVRGFFSFYSEVLTESSGSGSSDQCYLQLDQGPNG